MRTHEDVNLAVDPFTSARNAAWNILEEIPKMYAQDVIARVFAQAGESISPASVSRMRSRLKQKNAE